MVVLGLCCYKHTFSSCGELGLLCCSAQTSHCGCFSCGARALGKWALAAATGRLSRCSGQALWCMGFSLHHMVSLVVCGPQDAQAPVVASVVAAHGLWSLGSVAVVYGLSCFMVRVILLDQGLNLPCIGRAILIHSIPREVPSKYTLSFLFYQLIEI